jgi:hypothetical protein
MITSPMLARQITLLTHPLQTNSFTSMCLQPLELSCLSFCDALPLFSIACSLFLQNTGGGGRFRCTATLEPSGLRTFGRPVTRFPATHIYQERSREAKKRPLSPFPATHAEMPSCKSFACHTSKKRGVSLCSRVAPAVRLRSVRFVNRYIIGCKYSRKNRPAPVSNVAETWAMIRATIRGIRFRRALAWVLFAGTGRAHPHTLAERALSTNFSMALAKPSSSLVEVT